VIWAAALILFLVVEAIEILRAVQRVRTFGWKAGLFSYSVSQWSRNFTFGMFVAFSMYLPVKESFIAHHYSPQRTLAACKKYPYILGNLVARDYFFCKASRITMGNIKSFSSNDFYIYR
jgi:hypothetical protein